VAARKHNSRGRSWGPPEQGPPEERPSSTESEAAPAIEGAASLGKGEDNMREDKPVPTYGVQTETQNIQRPMEGVSVIGEAVRGTPAESAEFLIEITAGAASASQSLRDNHVKSTQIMQAIAALGVQPGDLQTISLNVYNLYSQGMPALPVYGSVPGSLPQIGQAGGFVQPDVQFGSYHARKTVRVVVREPARVGEIADAAARTGAIIVGQFTFKATDEAAARRSALEAAGKDARAKAETLAAAAGKQLGDPVAVSEDIIATNGAYAALRSAVPFAFGAGAPQVAGDLEYYARVSARYRFQ
jgi:uncharacterized protein YggE